MQVAIYNGQTIDKQRTFLDIPKIYKIVKGTKLDKRQWIADGGKIDGLDVTEWLKSNGVTVETHDSVFSKSIY